LTSLPCAAGHPRRSSPAPAPSLRPPSAHPRTQELPQFIDMSKVGLYSPTPEGSVRDSSPASSVGAPGSTHMDSVDGYDADAQSDTGADYPRRGLVSRPPSEAARGAKVAVHPGALRHALGRLAVPDNAPSDAGPTASGGWAGHGGVGQAGETSSPTDGDGRGGDPVDVSLAAGRGHVGGGAGISEHGVSSGGLRAGPGSGFPQGGPEPTASPHTIADPGPFSSVMVGGALASIPEGSGSQDRVYHGTGTGAVSPRRRRSRSGFAAMVCVRVCVRVCMWVGACACGVWVWWVWVHVGRCGVGVRRGVGGVHGPRCSLPQDAILNNPLSLPTMPCAPIALPRRRHIHC
jgi:hypothetical protein